MLSEKLLNELNEQIKYELFSANYYLSMAAYCATENFNGVSNFFMVQAEEENFHAMKFFNFILEMGGKVTMTGLDAPRTEFQSLEEIYTLALEHEQFVTKRIYTLMDIATAEKEYATINFLKWFVDEQVEEEATMNDILARVKLLGDKGQGIYHLDRELAARKFSPPSA